MPDFIDAFERKPVKFGKYHVKLNGTKEVIRYEEFDRMMERYDTVEWLDETVESKPLITLKKVSLMEAILSGSLAEKHYHQLSNLMGIKKAEKIKKTANQLRKTV